jgi:hypothetical protein
MFSVTVSVSKSHAAPVRERLDEEAHEGGPAAGQRPRRVHIALVKPLDKARAREHPLQFARSRFVRFRRDGEGD